MRQLPRTPNQTTCDMSCDVTCDVTFDVTDLVKGAVYDNAMVMHMDKCQ